MKPTEKNYQVRITGRGCPDYFAKVFGTTAKSAIAAARRLYPGDYDYYLWHLYPNGEWGYDFKVLEGVIYNEHSV